MCGRYTYLFKWKGLNRPKDLTHTYDRPGNRLTRYDGRPGARMPNWEFEYEYDGLDRLAEARRGSWDGSTFTAAAGTQEWALDLLGNWATFRHDRNGDGDFNDSSEVEDRTHNAANEVASAAIQGLGGSPFAQRHDHAGNWTRSVRSGAQRRDYVHDAWNRLVKATDDTQPATVRGEYEYNGLHWRTVKRLPGSSTTAERRLFYSASWQVLEERIDDDVDEGFEADRVAQQVWGVRYIDDAVPRRMDANADGDYVDEGDRVDYYLTDAQFSVVAVVGPTGALRERVVYSPYGEARHHWPADLDGDGDVDSGDMAWYQNSANLVGIGHANYNPDADLNRDGVVGTQDIILALNWNGKAALAAGLVSDPNGPDSPVGYCGYLFNAETGLCTVRFRHYDPVWGRWLQRDPAGYVDGMSRYEYVRSRSILLVDSDGWVSESLGPHLEWRGFDSQRLMAKVLLEAIRALCPRATLITRDGEQALYTVTMRDTGEEKELQRRSTGQFSCDPADDDCDDGPGCKILEDLATDSTWLTVITGPREFREGIRDRRRKENVYDYEDKTLYWDYRNEPPIWGRDDWRYAETWEVLWHEMLHALRHKQGLADGFSREEEIAVINAMNEMREWYRKCHGDDTITDRDPDSHAKPLPPGVRSRKKATP